MSDILLDTLLAVRAAADGVFKWVEPRDFSANVYIHNLRKATVLLDTAIAQVRDEGWQDIATAPKGVPVIVEGGLAMQKTGGEWFSGMEEPLYQRSLQWTPSQWHPIPKLPTTKDKPNA